MKKKLKDFTEEEIDKICDKYIDCKGCPFEDKYEFWCQIFYRDIMGDLEIEYEQEERKK